MKRFRIPAIVLGSTAFLGGSGCSALLGIDELLPPDGGASTDAAGDTRSDASDAGSSAEPPLDGGGGDAQTPNTGVCAVCSPNASCSLDGGVTCTCNFGWTGDGGTCVNDGPTCAGASGACVRFAPSGGIGVDDLDGTGLLPFVVPLDAIAPPLDAGADAGDAGPPPPGETILNVDTGEIVHAGVVLRPPSAGNPTARDLQAGIGYRQTFSNVALIAFRSLVVPEGATLRLVGTRAVGLASATTMRVDGVIDARAFSADGATLCPNGSAGPGASAGGSPGYLPRIGAHTPGVAGSGPGKGAGGSNLAGGGAGHGGAGGAVCRPTDGGMACSSGGVPYDAPELDESNFHGGSGGGGGDLYGGPVGLGSGFGGGGGGAVRLVAVDQIEIGGGAIRGGINASGCGGAEGATPGNISGGGGGSGGAIVLESSRVILDANAALTAGGGGGGYNNLAGATLGLGGDTAAGCYARMGSAYDNLVGSGGGDVTPDGLAGVSQDCAGGGGAGRIRINSVGGTVVGAATARLSPATTTAAYSVGSVPLRSNP